MKIKLYVIRKHANIVHPEFDEYIYSVMQNYSAIMNYISDNNLLKTCLKSRETSKYSSSHYLNDNRYTEDAVEVFIFKVPFKHREEFNSLIMEMRDDRVLSKWFAFADKQIY